MTAFMERLLRLARRSIQARRSGRRRREILAPFFSAAGLGIKRTYDFVGQNTRKNVGQKLGACYADCEIRNVKTIGATDYHIYLDECWAMEVINCYIGTDPLSRTTSGSDTLTGDLTFLGIQLQRVQS